MAKDEAAASLTYEQLKELIEAGKQPSITPEQIADIAASAAVKAKLPENKVGTGKSVYSTPEGETANPKGRLKCKMYMGGAPLERGTLTPGEIEALNGITPGRYRVRLADQELTDPPKKVIEVQGRVNANHEVEMLAIILNPEDPDKNNLGSITRLAKQFVEANRVTEMAVA